MGRLLGLVAIILLSGCAGVSSDDKSMIAPYPPHLESLERNDRDGISLDKADSAELYEYIEQLRKGYE